MLSNEAKKFWKKGFILQGISYDLISADYDELLYGYVFIWGNASTNTMFRNGYTDSRRMIGNFTQKFIDEIMGEE